MSTIQITIEAEGEEQEILISRLEDEGAEGFEQTDEKLLAYFPAFTFRSYEVNELLKKYTHQVQTLEEKNWNEVWESNFQPVIVSGFCAVRAEFHQPIPDVEHEIIITPKMSFGTGHHATTYMMMEQMNELDFHNKHVFDFGTGTGILSILAEKLGAVEILAIDIDQWSITNAIENSEKNGCEKIRLNLSTDIPEQKFDMILANINRNVLLQYSSQLKSVLSSEGKLLLSGLLETDEADIAEAFRIEGLEVIKRKVRSGWISLLFVHSSN